MFSALFSFLGGSAFRLLFGHIADFFEKKQDHQFEIERMHLQADLDQSKHVQEMENIRLQAELGVKEITVQADADVSRLEATAFIEAMKTANVKIGIWWVDAWNGVIRPLVATVCICLWIGALIQASFVLSDWDKDLIGVAIGFFFASRVLISGKK